MSVKGRKRPAKDALAAAWTPDERKRVREWLQYKLQHFLTAQARAKEGFKLSNLETVKAQIAYNRNAASAVRWLIYALDRASGANPGVGEAEADVPRVDAAPGVECVRGESA